MAYRISASVSDELGAKIEEVAKKYSISKSAIISIALSQYIYNNYALQHEILDDTVKMVIDEIRDEVVAKVTKQVESKI